MLSLCLTFQSAKQDVNGELVENEHANAFQVKKDEDGFEETF